MSLDVYLTNSPCEHCGRGKDQIFTANITHNLNSMADAAGIYRHLWRPEELGIVYAGELIKPLEEGLRDLKANPTHFKRLNPENGWGSYEGLVAFVEEYLEACKEHPKSLIEVSR